VTLAKVPAPPVVMIELQPPILPLQEGQTGGATAGWADWIVTHLTWSHFSLFCACSTYPYAGWADWVVTHLAGSMVVVATFPRSSLAG